MHKWPDKDPSDVLEYGFDWADQMAEDGDDTIATSTWTVVPETITKDVGSKTTTITTVKLSGGTAGVTYEFTNRIVTDGGRTYERSVSLYVRDR